MKTVEIDLKMKALLPDLVLGVIEADVSVEDNVKELVVEMNRRVDELKEKLVVADLKDLQPLKAGRSAYRRLGKDPTKYRISSEKLLRRGLKGQSMPVINTVVDVSNIVSMVSGHSVGTYDCDKIGPSLIFSFGKEGETYQSLGSQSINLKGLPIFKDDSGPFGSSTTDSSRSVVDLQTKRIVMNIISFSGQDKLEENMTLAEKLLVRYCGGKSIIKQIIK